MSFEAKCVQPCGKEGQVRDASGKLLKIPASWTLIPPGDPALTRRVKTSGPSWVVQEQKGRRTFSKGVWAETARVEAIRAKLVEERSKPAYEKRRANDKARREKEQTRYSAEFEAEVRAFLAFHLKYDELERRLAKLVSEHATPVGSGTVARTQRIRIGKRAEAAVIAWLRHQTTAYDSLKIARVKGRRREVRHELASRSRELLDSYRRGDELSIACPLAEALR